MWVSLLFVATVTLYAVASGAFLSFLARGKGPRARGAMWLLSTAALAHVGYVLADWQRLGNEPLHDLHGTLSLLSLLIVVAFILAARSYRVSVLGAFITPLTLLFLLGAGLSHGASRVPDEVRSVLGPVHISLNLLGIVAFALAFSTATGYIIQERLLKQKRIGGIFQRLPSLDVLDSLSLRMVMVGFPLLTLGIVTGTIWAVRVDPSAPALSAGQVFGLLTWLVFASVLLFRVLLGWRGRRAAIGTIMGFLCAMAVLAGYALRATGGAL